MNQDNNRLLDPTLGTSFIIAIYNDMVEYLIKYNDHYTSQTHCSIKVHTVLKTSLFTEHELNNPDLMRIH